MLLCHVEHFQSSKDMDSRAETICWSRHCSGNCWQQMRPRRTARNPVQRLWLVLIFFGSHGTVLDWNWHRICWNFFQFWLNICSTIVCWNYAVRKIFKVHRLNLLKDAAFSNYADFENVNDWHRCRCVLDFNTWRIYKYMH